MNLTEVAGRLKNWADKIQAERGQLELLGLFLRDGSPDLWDLVIAAHWLKGGDRGSFVYVADQLRSVLAKEELAELSRIVILEHGGAVLEHFLERFGGQVGLADVHFLADGGALIEKAYVLVARPVGREGSRSRKKSGRMGGDSRRPSRPPTGSRR